MTVSPPSARALHAQAKDLANAGDLPGAEAVLREARSQAADGTELALVDGTLAWVEAEQGRVEEALARCLRALERPGLTPHGRAVLAGQLGFVRWVGGDTREAIRMFTQALAELEGNERTQVLLNRGTARLGIGDLDAARADYEEGQLGSDPVAAAKCAHNLGYVHLLRGELVDALRCMDRARPALADLGPAVTAVNDIDRAEALEGAGLDREAIGLLRDVRRRLADTTLWRIQADVEVRLARLLSGAEAVALAESAAERWAAHGNEVEADQARAVALHLRSRLRRPPAAEELDAVADRLDRAGRTEAARALRVRAAGLRGEPPEPVTGSAPLATRLLAGEVAAEVALGAGATERALASARDAIDHLEDWQRRIGSLELQTTTRRLGVRVLRVGQRAALASDDPAALLEWSERARELVARGVPVRPPEQLGDLLAALRHLGPEGDPDERARLVEAVRHGRWHAGGSVEQPGLLTLDRLRSALDGRRFVSLLHVDDELVALVATADDVRVHRLGRWARLASRLGGLPADLAVTAQTTIPAVRAGLAERLAAIDDLLRPAWDGADDLVLTVHGALDRLPWGQLPSLRGVAVTLPTSATAWVRAAAAPLPHDRPAVVVGPGTLTGAEEAAAVRRTWAPAVDVPVRDGATCAEASALARSADLLHVCAHGHDRGAHPLLASMSLADGPWFGHDVELLPRAPALVVLSACGIGGGSLGMARAWLHAGARRVIAAPADIAERAAAERFPALHALLAAGVAPERAVAEAFGPDALDCAVQCYGPA